MRVLLVDDDALFCGIINTALQKHGYQTSIACNGDDALKKIHGGEFDLLITDILMPQKEGIELIQEVRQTNPKLKIIAISSGGQTGYTSFLRIAETFGADASLKKPFTADQLIDKVKEVTENKLSA